MVGLVDIAPASERVTIRGSEVDVYGVSASGIAQLLARFPDLRKMIAGRDVDVEELMGMGGELVAAICAAGTGSPGDADAERAADRLSVDEQADLLLAIVRVTLPNGVGPFVEKLTGAGNSLGVSVPDGGQAAARATKSARPSRN